MSQSLAKNLLHLVFTTKNRIPWIDQSIRPKLFSYMAGIMKEWESPILVIGGVTDHVHILFILSKNYPLKRVIEEVK